MELVCSSHTISGVMPNSGGPTSRHPFELRLAACQAAGYKGLCLHYRDYWDQREAGFSDAQLRAALARYEMRHLSVEFLTNWFIDTPVSRDNERRAFAAVEAYRCSILNVGPDLAGHDVPWAQMKEQFSALCARAARSGISIALEIVAWSNVRDVDTALDLIDGIDNAGLVLDIWHFSRGGIDFADIARIPADRILGVQLNDGELHSPRPMQIDTTDRSPCGDGEFDVQGFVRSLLHHGYNGSFAVEIISLRIAQLDPFEAAARTFESTYAAVGV